MWRIGLLLLLCVVAAIPPPADRLVHPFAPPAVYNYTCEQLSTDLFASVHDRLAESPISQLVVHWGALVFHDLATSPALDASFLYGNSTRRTYVRGELALNPYGELDPAFLADPAGTETVQLYALYVLLAHAHNKRARHLYEHDTRRSDETLFRGARAYIAAMVQKITIYDWLPLLTPLEVPRFVDPGASAPGPVVLVEFAHAWPALLALASSDRVLYSDQNKELSEIPLEEGFDAPEQMHRILGGLEGACTVVTGAMRDPMHRIHNREIDALRGKAHVQSACERMRTAGTPAVLETGAALGLWAANASDFDVLTTCDEGTALATALVGNQTEAEALRQLDLLGGMALEEHADGGVLGRLAGALLWEQLVHRTRGRDPHWFEADSDARTGLSKKDRKRVKASSFVDLVGELCAVADNVHRGGEFVLWRVSDVDVVIEQQSDLDDANLALVGVLTGLIFLFLAAVVFVFFKIKRK